jgi:hypothetical protein
MRLVIASRNGSSSSTIEIRYWDTTSLRVQLLDATVTPCGPLTHWTLAASRMAERVGATIPSYRHCRRHPVLLSVAWETGEISGGRSNIGRIELARNGGHQLPRVIFSRALRKRRKGAR